jgi:hypothetical protein
LTYTDWQESVRLLELSTGPFTTTQRTLAEQFGMTLQGNEPNGVVGVMLEERLMPLIWSAEAAAELASERQRNFLRALGAASTADSTSLTKRVASAWIDHHLAIKTADSLRRLQLKTGDAVIKRSVWRKELLGIPPHETLEFHYVSSIGADGLVYFKGGNGKCGWPSSLHLAGPEDDPSSYPQVHAIGDE